jgi:hypothetical protein
MIRIILIITHTVIMRPYDTQQVLKLQLFFGVFREMSIAKRQEQLSPCGFFSPGVTSNSLSLTESKSSGSF